MASNKYDAIWELFDKYEFEIDYKTYKDLICIICDKILINATQSSCGCRYCYSCISTYLNQEIKCCPRKSEDCKNHLINSKNDLQIDHAANKIISKIEVKCPESQCEVKTKLQNMTEHIQKHQFQCPYHIVGCQANHNNSEALEQHLIEDLHVTMLSKFLENVKSENNKLNARVSESEVRMEELTAMNADISQQLTYVKNGENEMINKLKILEEDGHYKQNVINQMMEEIVKIQSKLKCLEQKLQPESHQVNANTIPRRSSTLMVTSPTLVRQQYSPFTWSVGDFLTKWDSARNGIEKFVNSDIFLTGEMGYCLRLSLYPNGYGTAENTYISVLFGLMEGEFDHKLAWPMKQEIMIALIDQESGSFHVSEKFSYDGTVKQSKYIFHKPSTKYTNNNYMYGALKFIKIDSLISNNRLFKNGSILLKCFVH